jgi:hypothetical protein
MPVIQSFLSLLILIGSPWSGLPIPNSLDQLTLIVDQCEHPSLAGWAIAQYLEIASPEEIKDAVLGESDTLAIEVKWLELQHQFSQKDATDRFVEFFEGRTRKRIPDDWIRSLNSSFDKRIGGTDLTGTSDLLPNLKVPANCVIEKKEKTLEIKNGDDLIVLNLQSLEKIIPLVKGNFDRLRIESYQNNYYLIFYGSSHITRIICVRENEIIWSRKLWTTGWGGFSESGPTRYYFISSHVDSEDLVIFGFGDAIYIESYRLTDGRPSFCFNPNLWNWKQRQSLFNFGRHYQDIRNANSDAFIELSGKDDNSKKDILLLK